MHLKSFDYKLPQNLIAQHPLIERDQARLMVVHRATGAIEYRRFFELPEILDPTDLLVLNDTRVVPARLRGRRAQTGGKWAGLFLGELPDGSWELLSRTRGHLTAGEIIDLDPGPLRLLLVAKTGSGQWLARPQSSAPAPASALELLARHGHVPLPPYIRKGHPSSADSERYQTIFARHAGAVAAPTAGLHFSPAVFRALASRGIASAFVTLHVGLGTFQPIQADEVAAHVMHEEWGELSHGTVDAVKECQVRRGRVVAVGTTSVRLLESVAAAGPLQPWSGRTKLYIHPPYCFRIVDALITNFHLPRTSLLVLVSAFAGIDLIQTAYKKAIEAEYRFYSYGDAMLIL